MPRFLANRTITTVKALLLLAAPLFYFTAHAEAPQFFQDKNELRDEYYKIPIEWLRCSDVLDCTLLKGVCGEWSPVNRRYQKNLEEWAQKLNNSMSCKYVAGPKPEILCRNDFCDYMLFPNK